MTEPPNLLNAPARKALGQHFLFDPDILRRTALAAGPVDGRTVFEVGPGPGGLTRALLDQGAKRVIAVEADARFAAALRTWPETASGRLHVIEADARRVRWASALSELDADLPAMVIANLPYNVGTPLLVDWLKAGAWRGEMALMFQKEVAERICAQPGDRHYGRLAVLAAAVTKAHLAFSLPPGAFKPPPKVESAVAVLHPLPENACYHRLDTLEAVSAAAFGQRRKMLRGALKSLAKTHGVSATDWLDTAGVAEDARAETVDQSGFRRLADALLAMSPKQDDQGPGNGRSPAGQATPRRDV
ncbi:MAG: 16S rRNA (adenine(1518)-N(6)/adenine(1519)-N(6))-dimethyltransferase RsmA [Pseudomonadota bacterium]